MVDKMQAIDPQKFADLTPADLQAIMWFLEKEIWEKSGWTKVQGAANSARALAAAQLDRALYPRWRAGGRGPAPPAPARDVDVRGHGPAGAGRG